MADLSSLSDDDLKDAYEQAQGSDVTKLSDKDLMQAYQSAQFDQNPFGQADEYGRPPVGSSPEFDSYLANSGIGHILDAVGHGAKQAWGTEEIVSPDTADLLRKAGVFPDAAKPQHDIIRGFNEALLRPAAAGLDMAIRAGGQFMRATGAAIGGLQAGVAQAGEELGVPGLGRDIAALPEALPQEFMGARGVLETPPHVAFNLDAARAEGVLGTEEQWKGIAPPTEDFPVGTTTHFNVPAEAKTVGEAMQPYEATLSPDVQQMLPPQDIHEAARRVAPSVFDEYDSLREAQISLREQVTGEQNALRQAAEDQAPHAAEIADLEERLQDTTPRLAKKYQARLDALAPERDAFLNDEFTMAALTRDTPQIAAMRQQIQEIDYRMRDLAPDVTAAYREAEKQFPEEGVAPSAAATPEPNPTPPVSEAQERPVPVPGEPAVAPGMIRLYHGGAADPTTGGGRWVSPYRDYAEGYAKKSGGKVWYVDVPTDHPEVLKNTDFNAVEGTNMKAPIAHFETSEGLARQMKPLHAPSEPAHVPAAVSATKPLLNIAADVSQKLVAAGRPVEEADAAGAVQEALWRTRADAFGDAKGSAEEMYANEAPEIRAGQQRTRARQPEMAQTKQGKIRLTDDGRAVITLFKDANASTFLHETGHDWLERMVRDSEDPDAPQHMRDDAATVRKYLGNDGSDLTTAQHEKFARSFERYFMEGHAPSRGLASVFEKFRDWLTTIYQTVARLKAPITEDIRDVFDRLLTTKPERATIAKETEFKDKMLAGLNAEVEPNKIAANITDDLADLHETDAQTTAPEQATAAADQVRQEVDHTAEIHAPEIADALRGADVQPAATGMGSDAAKAGGPAGGDAGAGPDAGQAQGAAKPQPVNEGGAGAAGKGNAGANAGAAPEPKLPPLDVKTEAPDFRTKEDREIEKAANIRLDKLNTKDDMSQALRDLAAQNGDFMDARYGTIAYQTQLEIRNTRTLLRAATSDLMEAAAEAAKGDVEAIGDFARKQERAAMIFSHLSTLSADWAHAGHELNRVMPEWDKAMNIAQQIQDTTGRTLFQLQEQAKVILDMPTAEQAGKMAGDAQMTRWQRIRAGIISYFVNNLISGPLTHMAYSVGNEVTALYRMGPETLVSAATGALRNDADRVYFGEAGAQLWASVRGMTDGIAPAMKALKTGIAVLPGQPETFGFRPQSIPGRLGYVLETPSRVVTAIHTLFYTMNYEAEIARQAYRAAASRGLRGADFDAEIARLTSSPTSAMTEAADTEATRGVLMKRPEFGSAQYHLAQIVNNNIAAKLIMPFMQIGMNILQEGIVERTPLAMLSGKARAELVAGGAARDLRIGKIATGSMLGGAAVGLAASGYMTGGGPVDPNQRRVLEDSGWKAYSIKYGDTYIPYRKYLGFLGPLVAGAADMYEVGHLLHGEDLTKAAAAMAFGFSEVVADETWMTGLTSFIEAARNWDTKGEAYIRNLATSFIPFSVGLSQTARMVDPYQRQVRTLVDAARNKIPGLSEELEPRIGIWGQPITSHTMLSPSTLTNDPVDARLRVLGLGVTPVERKITGISLTDQQYTQYAKTAGMLAHQRLSAMVQTPGFAQMPAGIQTRAIQDTISKSRDAARAMIKMQNPAIIRQATENKQKLRANGKPGAEPY